jgi:hypothetical protein
MAGGKSSVPGERLVVLLPGRTYVTLSTTVRPVMGIDHRPAPVWRSTALCADMTT